jgi:hypothetical protein
MPSSPEKSVEGVRATIGLPLLLHTTYIVSFLVMNAFRRSPGSKPFYQKAFSAYHADPHKGDRRLPAGGWAQ